jgi:nitroreductase
MSLDSHFLDSLRWRYAVKKMNGNKISADKLNTILEATRLSPASFGLQSYKVLVIEDAATRAALKPACWNQSQIVDSSAILVFAIWDDVTEANIDTYMAEIADERGVDIATLADFKGYIMGTVNSLDVAGRQAWAARQTYIALGFALAAAAVVGVDSTPMEGFVPAQVDEILGLPAKGLRSSLILALGERDAANDYLVNAKKVRRSKENFFEFI